MIGGAPGVNPVLGNYEPHFGPDLSVASVGYDWFSATSYNSRQEVGQSLTTEGGTFARHVSDGYQGKNWFQNSQPELTRYFFTTNGGGPVGLGVGGGGGENEEPPGPEEQAGATRMLAITYNANRRLSLRPAGTRHLGMKGTSGSAEELRFPTGTGTNNIHLVRYTDRNGRMFTFFGWDSVPSSNVPSHVVGQLWKVEDFDSNLSYVGHPTDPVQAFTIGYGLSAASRGIKVAHDASGNRFSYTYSTTPIGGVIRLLEVRAERFVNSAWELVEEVNYTYYGQFSAPDEGIHGMPGDLKLVSRTVPQSDPSQSVQFSRYYRYYVGQYASESNPGTDHLLKMAVDFEGYRRASLDHGSVLALSDAALQPYATSYLEYHQFITTTNASAIDGTAGTDYLVRRAIVGGSCGCSGSQNSGQYDYVYERNTGNLNANYYLPWGGGLFQRLAGDDNGPLEVYNWGAETWYSRTTITRPDGTVAVSYFDREGNVLGEVIRDSQLQNAWATKYMRDSQGRIAAVATPAAVQSYNHTNASTVSPMPLRANDGLIRYTTYRGAASGVAPQFPGMSGAVWKTGHSKGIAGDVYIDSETTYLVDQNDYETGAFFIGGGGPSTITSDYFVVANHLPGSVKFFENTLWDAPTPNVALRQEYSYTFYASGAAGPLDDWRVASATVTHSAVPVAQNGANLTHSEVVEYDRERRRTAFEDRLGRRNEWSYDDYGRLIEQRIDVGTGSGPMNLLSTHVYDLQGRLIRSTGPDGNTSYAYFTRLADGRGVTLSGPRVSGTTFFGPASMGIFNHAGNAEAWGELVFSGSSGDVLGTTTTSIGQWINSSATQPIAAVAHGTLQELGTAAFSSDGLQRLQSRRYLRNPLSTTWPGASGIDFDQTSWQYDNAGRVELQTDPTGTISKTEYDSAGRYRSSWIGTTLANLVKQSEVEYDGGGVGNGHTTKLTEFAGSSDTRITTFEYDFRGRRIFTNSPVGPYLVMKYDTLGRAVASGQYLTAAGLSASTDPTLNATNRFMLLEHSYDARSQNWRTVRTATQVGTSSQSLTSRRWFDPAGRLVFSWGDDLVKLRRDRLGRVIQQHTLASTASTGSNYASVWTPSDGTVLTGDIVLEETHTGYEASTGNVLLSVSFSRRHSDTATGPLENDGNPLAVSGSALGRAQVTAHWYDVLNRPIRTAFYGTNTASGDVGAINRVGLTMPSVSASDATRLVSANEYGHDGRLRDVKDASARTQRTLYDFAGRPIVTIANFTGATTPITNPLRDTDVFTRYQYFAGQRTKLWVDLNGDDFMDPAAGDQVTTYVYGTSSVFNATDNPVPSTVNSGHLLRAVVYPEQQASQPAADRTVYFAYNYLGQEISTRDQDGTVIETDYDNGGRKVARKAPVLGTDIDGLVQRIEMGYDQRGLVNRVTQYGAPSGGTVIDEVTYAYDPWNNVADFKQDVDGVVGGSAGRASFGMRHAYANVAPANASNTVRRLSTTYFRSHDFANAANEFEKTIFGYGTSASVNDNMSRVETVSVSTGGATPAQVAKYDYLGIGELVGTEVATVGGSVRTAVFGSSGYADLDRFNRPTKWDWQRVVDGAPGRVFYDHDIVYDNSSNITWTRDLVHQRIADGKRVFDMKYSHDGLDRLTGAQQGNVDLVSQQWTIDTTKRNETWPALSQTGNWATRSIDANGDGDLLDATDRLEPSANNVFSNANEWNQRRVSFGSSTTNRDDFDYGYSKSGHMTSDSMVGTRQPGPNLARYRHFVYDAFGRLRKVLNGPPGESSTIMEYRYNGLGYRTMWNYDADADGLLETSERYYFLYDDRWRKLATFRDQDAHPKEAFVYHNSGGGGFGGSSYVDSVILRDRDAATAWAAQSDATLEERRYLVQNWRADVVAVLRGDGRPTEFIRYSAYGEATTYPMADINRDGIVSSADMDDFYAIQSEAGEAAAPWDVDFDGSTAGDSTDETYFLESYNANNGFNGVGKVGTSGTGLRKGYAGYEHDIALQAYHVRHRVYMPEIGRWTKRDPLGYVDGMSVYGYANSLPVVSLDPDGLDAVAATIIPAIAPAIPAAPALAPALVCIGGIVFIVIKAPEVVRETDGLIDDIKIRDPKVRLTNKCFKLYMAYKNACGGPAPFPPVPATCPIPTSKWGQEQPERSPMSCSDVSKSLARWVSCCVLRNRFIQKCTGRPNQRKPDENHADESTRACGRAANCKRVFVAKGCKEERPGRRWNPRE